jgi:preprotein translocase subunit SecA
LTDIEDLRRGIGLEAYGQRDPLIEYKRRAFELFEELGDNIRRTTIRILFRQPPEVLSPRQGAKAAATREARSESHA